MSDKKCYKISLKFSLEILEWITHLVLMFFIAT